MYWMTHVWCSSSNSSLCELEAVVKWLSCETAEEQSVSMFQETAQECNVSVMLRHSTETK